MRVERSAHRLGLRTKHSNLPERQYPVERGPATSVSPGIILNAGRDTGDGPSASLCGLARLYLALDAPTEPPPRDFEVIVGLQVEPVILAKAEVPRQTQGCVRRDRSLALDNLAQAVRGDAQRMSKLINAHPQGREQVVPQDSTGMRRHPVFYGPGHRHLLVVIRNLDLKGISVAPHETYAILVVDPDAVLSGPIAFEGFQSVTGEDGQISQRPRRVDLYQPSLNDIGNSTESLRGPAVEYRFGISGPK